jgi:hypothetical protein
MQSSAESEKFTLPEVVFLVVAAAQAEKLQMQRYQALAPL